MGVKDLQDLKKISMLRSQINGKGIEDIMDTDFPTVKPDERLADALVTMRKTGYQEIPVIEDGEHIGTISYGTILKKKNIALDSKVRNLLNTPPIVTKDMSITQVAELMVVNNSRQLAVVNGNKKKVIGVVTRSRMIELIADIKAFKEIKVWEIMTNPVESVKNRALLDDAMDIMRRLDVRTVPVVGDSGKIVGIIGMREIIDNNWKNDNKVVGDLSKSKKAQLNVESVCTTVAHTVKWDDDLDSAVKLMSEYKISTLPVVEGDELVGILTQYDIIELISACRERDFLFVQISGLDDNDKVYTSAIYEEIKDQIDKISKISKPESLSMHVGKYKEKDENSKYSISARLIINGDAVSAKEVGWDLVSTADSLMKKICDSVINTKDTKDTFRKRKR